MAHSSNETLSIGWCDNGMVDGKFTEGLMYTTITAPTRKLAVNNAIRVQGNQIGRQRQALLDMWYDQVKTDWLLWVDSDIVLTLDVLEMLWKTADKIARPVVSGVYFISKQMESSLMQPMPALFNETGDEYQIRYLHPLPASEVVEVDNAGLGLTMMHRSVVPLLRQKFPNESMFAEIENLGDKFVGEDIVFFRKLKAAGIKVHAHTGARVKHMKRFAYDDNYYALYWQAAQAAERQAKEKANDNTAKE
jgi:Glycosyltransferase like family 2